jgi:hypothetical protein
MKINDSTWGIVNTYPMRIRFASKKRTPLNVAVLIALLLSLGISTRLKAQAVGATLNGTVTDASGAVVPNATITITNTATGVARTASTNDAGLYSAPNLQPGDYGVTATAAGFATESTKLTLTVGAQQTLNLSLKVGTSTQTVEITSAAPNINLVESTLGGLNTESQIKELPLNGRSWSDLANLAPGVYSIHEQPLTSSRDRYTRGFGQELSISGNRPQQNNYRLDGISIMDAEQGAPGSLLGGNLGVDAISEFSVLTTNYSTEYGRAAGGVVNATTKSGTNQFHGNAYEFLRNSALDGRNFFDGATVPQFRRNQFGGSAGGPIKKDRVFIFGDYEGLRQVLNATQSSPVPTAAARQGILQGGTPLPPGFACPANSTIPVPGQSTVCVDAQAARFLAAFFPLPNSGISGDTGNFEFGRPTNITENYFIVRSDQTLSDKNSIHETYMFDRSGSSEVDELKNKDVNSKIHRQVLVLDESHSVSPTFLLDTRFGISRIWSGAPLNGTAINPAAADPSFASVTGTQGPAQIFVNGLVQFSGGLSTTSPQRDGWTAWQGYEDAFVSRGIHSIKFGAGIEWDKWNRFYTPRAGGQWNFGSLATFLQNSPAGTNLTADTAGDPTKCPFPQYSCLFPRGMRETIIGLYIQDDIKVRHNLTFNIGLRYEPTSVPSEVHGQVAGLTTVTAIPEPGKGQHVGNPLYVNNTLKNFSPRVGFAWDPFSTGKTSIRGGFGFYDAQSYLNFFNNPFSSSAPFYFSIANSNLVQGDFPFKAFTNGVATLTQGLPCPVTTSRGCSTGTLLYPDGGASIDAATRAAYVQQNPPRSYVMQYNLSFQRELTPSLTLLFGYVGSHGVHGAHVGDDLNIVAPSLYVGRLPVWSCEPFVPAGTTPPAGMKVGCNGIGLGEPVGYNLNTATGGPVGGQFARLNPFVGREAISGYRNSSVYNGLQVQITKRMSHSFQVTGSFTYQRSIDESSGNQAGDEFLNEISSNPTTLPSYLTRGASSFNVPKVLAVNYLWQIPTPQSVTGIARGLLGGWQFGGIFTASNGTPFTVVLAGDITGWNSTDPWAYPDRLRGPGCASVVNRSDYLHYVKTQCFIAPAAVVATDPVTGLTGQHFMPYGNAGRNFVPGPNLWNLDFSLVKNTPVKRISETFNVQFRVEAFNAFNHTNFNSPIDNQFIIDPTKSGIGIVPADPSVNITSNAGAINKTATTSRQMQFALKLIW